MEPENTKMSELDKIRLNLVWYPFKTVPELKSEESDAEE
jgi:hypothetical protein